MPLQHICENAARVGRQIDLAGCNYGPHKRSGLYLGVSPYYHFLSGFVQTLDLKKVLEIGTSYGGSMMAISRGCRVDQRSIEMVTVDKVDIAGEGLTGLLHIKRVHGDSLAPDTLREVRRHLSPPIDLLYIDSKHSYEHTNRNFVIYGAELRPHFVIFDDIHLNQEMKRFWNDISDTFRHFAYDASELAERPSGFGVLDFAGSKPSPMTPNC